MTARTKMLTSYHALWLMPVDAEPAPPGDWFSADRLIAVVEGPSVVIRTRIHTGFIWATVHSPATASEPLEEHRRAGGWEVAEEEDILITSPLALCEMDGTSGIRDAVAPELPGLHRVRVLAKGHMLNDPFERVDFEEEFEVVVRPTDTPAPRARAIDPAMPWRQRLFRP